MYQPIALVRKGSALNGDPHYIAAVRNDLGVTTVLHDKRGKPRKFKSYAAAIAAAQKEIKVRTTISAPRPARKPVPHVASRLLSGVTMPKNPLTIWRQPRG